MSYHENEVKVTKILSALTHVPIIYIYASMVKIHQLVQEILWVQETIMLMPTKK